MLFALIETQQAILNTEYTLFCFQMRFQISLDILANDPCGLFM